MCWGKGGGSLKIQNEKKDNIATNHCSTNEVKLYVFCQYQCWPLVSVTLSKGLTSVTTYLLLMIMLEMVDE